MEKQSKFRPLKTHLNDISQGLKFHWLQVNRSSWIGEGWMYEVQGWDADICIQYVVRFGHQITLVKINTFILVKTGESEFYLLGLMYIDIENACQGKLYDNAKYQSPWISSLKHSQSKICNFRQIHKINMLKKEKMICLNLFFWVFSTVNGVWTCSSSFCHLNSLFALKVMCMCHIYISLRSFHFHSVC